MNGDQIQESTDFDKYFEVKSEAGGAYWKYCIMDWWMVMPKAQFLLQDLWILGVANEMVVLL